MKKRVCNKYGYDFFRDRLDEIEKAAIRLGKIEKLAKFLDISNDTLRTYRKELPELDKAINEAFKKHRPFTPAQLKRIVEMNKTCSKIDIAKFLGISTTTLRSYYKKYPELKHLRRGYIPVLTEDKLTSSVLDKVKSIMKTGFKKDVIKFLGIKSEETLRTYCAIYPKLNRAIESGINSRDKSFLFWKQSKLKADYIEYHLKQFKEISSKTGQQKLVAKFFNITPDSLRKTMRMHPPLNKAVQRGLARYKANQKSEKLSVKNSAVTESSNKMGSVEIYKPEKPKRVLVAEIRTIEDIGEEDALARYRRMKEAEREEMSRRELKEMEEFI